MPLDDRDTALINATVEALHSLVLATEIQDHDAISAGVVKLLNAVVAFNRSRPERPADAALVHAVAMLSDGWRQP